METSDGIEELKKNISFPSCYKNSPCSNFVAKTAFELIIAAPSMNSICFHYVFKIVFFINNPS